MVHDAVRRLQCALLLLGIVGVPGCSVKCDGHGIGAVDLNKLEVEALYPEAKVNALPRNDWTANPRLETFLRKTVKNDGIESLAKYGMQCTPSSRDTGCQDCFTCTKTFRDFRLDYGATLFYFETLSCVDNGEIRIHAEIGPGSRVVAMTYWKTNPAISAGTK